MKVLNKYLILFLTFLFLLTTSVGITISSHYCGDKLMQKGIMVKTCCTKKSKCCKTKGEHLKVKEDFSKTASNYFKITVPIVALHIHNFFFKTPSKELCEVALSQNSSPPLIKIPLHIFFRSILI